ncbi:penicillin-binding protein 2 [Lysobacter alkalisoli]|uniref:Peptidoglycan D,D-transpeptidase MrdA n=1 Tax=Marilutibacter alkalisoli TaxID=2591633 RepID=A0A514BUW9_9GAMM|nr:penicillin-binding protein 2 [Lysobacter alkalisoli]
MRSHRRVLKNSHAEAEQFRNRALLAFSGVVVALGVLAGWYFNLQVLQHDEYATRSENNRIKLRPVVPARGVIYDRNGRILADNVPAFRVDVTPEEAGAPDKWLPGLAEIFSLTEEEIEQFEKARRTTRGFRPITLKMRVSEDEAARFAVDRWRYPGVELVSYLNRRYPHGELLSHVIGYVGRIDEDDLKTLGEANAALTHIGKTGIERSYDEALRGQVGFERVETNVEGRSMRVVGRMPAMPGADLRLSIDLDLQQAMADAFGEFEGAAVAMDPRTGEVLAMVSLPGYDTNLFVNGISHADYKTLIDNPSRPLFNRLVLGGVAPGSTLKPLIALAGLDSGMRQPEDRVMSTGMFYLPGVRRGWGDASRGGHGWTDLRKSISHSVNTYYYKLALDLGIERFAHYMREYGFGEPTGVDLVGEIGGILPSPEYKMQMRRERWYPGDTVNASIGQGDWKVTPLQLVRSIAGIADGSLRRPHLTLEQRGGFEAPWQALPQPPGAPISSNPENLQVVREGMAATMQPGGTGWRMALGAEYTMAGKTGTAQVTSRRDNAAVDPRSLPLHLRHRSLFVGFAPVEDPTIAVAVAVEGGGYGGSTAAPIARKIFDAWLTGAMPEPAADEPVPATIAESDGGPAGAETPEAGPAVTEARR